MEVTVGPPGGGKGEGEVEEETDWLRRALGVAVVVPIALEDAAGPEDVDGCCGVLLVIGTTPG